MWKAIAAVAVGGSLGALLRWWLGIVLNAYFPAIPPGTLAANLIGGYIIGVAVAVAVAVGVGVGAPLPPGNNPNTASCVWVPT